MCIQTGACLRKVQITGQAKRVYKSRNHQHKPILYLLRGWGSNTFFGWKAVSLAAQRSRLSADWACFAKEVLSLAGNVASCFLAVQALHVQQNQVESGWMATSTLRPIYYFLSASQPSPFCNVLHVPCNCSQAWKRVTSTIESRPDALYKQYRQLRECSMPYLCCLHRNLPQQTWVFLMFDFMFNKFQGNMSGGSLT